MVKFRAGVKVVLTKAWSGIPAGATATVREDWSCHGRYSNFLNVEWDRDMVPEKYWTGHCYEASSFELLEGPW